MAHLEAAPILGLLDGSTLTCIARRAMGRTHVHGTVLLLETSPARAGEPDGQVLLVVEGWCTGVRSQPDGSRAVVAVCRPGEVAGLERLVQWGHPAASPAWVASGDGFAIRLPVALLRRAIRACRAASDELSRAFASRAAQAEALLADRLLPPADRLLRALVELARRHDPPLAERRPSSGDPPGSFAMIPLTQAELAALVGTTRETVNRCLRRLSAAGLIALRDGRPIVIRRPGGSLRRVAPAAALGSISDCWEAR